MTNFFIGTYDFLRLIAKEIDDSRTFCRFSQTCKKANDICKNLLTSKIIDTGNWRARYELVSFMHNGFKHGLAKIYHTTNCDERPINEYYYLNNKKAVYSPSFWSELGTV